MTSASQASTAPTWTTQARGWGGEGLWFPGPRALLCLPGWEGEMQADVLHPLLPSPDLLRPRAPHSELLHPFSGDLWSRELSLARGTAVPGL